MATRSDSRDESSRRADEGSPGRRSPVTRWLRRSWKHGNLLATLWSTVLTAVLLGPALRPGFTLSYDMVFVPRQSLLPQSLGLGGGLPRAVPQDAVIALASFAVDGAWMQHAILLGIGILAGVGVARLVRPAGRGAELIGATLATWNPFVVERLVQGHWALLLAYALTPWAIHTALRMRRTGAGWPALIGWCAAGALVPSGGLLVVISAVPIAVTARLVSVKNRIAVLIGAIAVNLPWIAPALLHPNSGAAESAGTAAFALRAEGPWGPLVTALGGGGLWNAEAIPASRGSALAVVLTILVWSAAVTGWTRAEQLLGRGVTRWWTSLSLLGVVLASISVMAPQAWGNVISSIPGGGLARDSHKLLAPLVLLLAVLAALGVARWCGRITDRVSRRSVMVAAVVIPIALLPDAALGVSGRLAAVDYPQQWHQMREVLQADPRDGDVVVLPWSAFRRYAFADDRTVLDPAPRWLTRSSITEDDLPVARSEDIVIVPGDDPRSEAVTAALDAQIPLIEVMPALGARWVLVEVGQLPMVDPAVLEGLREQWRGGDLVILEIPEDSSAAGQVDVPGWPAGSAWVILIDLLVVVGLGVLAVTVLVHRGRARHRRIRPGSPEDTPRGHRPG